MESDFSEVWAEMLMADTILACASANASSAGQRPSTLGFDAGPPPAICSSNNTAKYLPFVVLAVC